MLKYAWRVHNKCVLILLLYLYSVRAKVPKWRHSERRLISRVNKLKRTISIWFDLIGFYANDNRIFHFSHFVIVMRGTAIDVALKNDVNALVG